MNIHNNVLKLAIFPQFANFFHNVALCVTRYNVISVYIGLYAKKTKTMQRLKPEDVPRAILRNNILLDNSLVELKRWLLCRGLPCTGNKNEIIARYTKLLLVQQMRFFNVAKYLQALLYAFISTLAIFLEQLRIS